MFSEETGRDLIDEIKHNEFRKFNSAGIMNTTREIENIQTKIDNLKQIAEQEGVTEELSINFAMLKAYKERCERIIRAYRLFRLMNIQDKYFNKNLQHELMSSDELKFVDMFDEIVVEYLDNYKHLSLNDRLPTLDFFVQILTLEDCGAVLCGDDFIELKKDRIYFLKRSDITHLLKKKLVKIV